MPGRQAAIEELGGDIEQADETDKAEAAISPPPNHGPNPNEPREANRRWRSAGARLGDAFEKAGDKDPLHVSFASVRQPAKLAELIGGDVRNFRHAASNQAMKHALDEHGDDIKEARRGQVGLTRDDFERLPQIIKHGQYTSAEPKPGFPPRVKIVSAVGGYEYHYIAQLARKKRRLNMVTMWKK